LSQKRRWIKSYRTMPSNHRAKGKKVRYLRVGTFPGKTTAFLSREIMSTIIIKLGSRAERLGPGAKFLKNKAPNGNIRWVKCATEVTPSQGTDDRKGKKKIRGSRGGGLRCQGKYRQGIKRNRERGRPEIPRKKSSEWSRGRSLKNLKSPRV